MTAVASLLYLFQERELKNKKPRKFYYRLPALGTLDAPLGNESPAFPSPGRRDVREPADLRDDVG